MKTIEKRAYKQYPPHQNVFIEELRSKGRAGYIKGARAQRKIDIKNACEWLEEHIYDYLHCDGPMEPYYISTNKLIKDFQQVIKRE